MRLPARAAATAPAGPTPPTIFRGTFTIDRAEHGQGEEGGAAGTGGCRPRFPFPPDTWAAVGTPATSPSSSPSSPTPSASPWVKGVLFVNGHNAGWYWPARGPQNTLFLPGPWLRWGQNEVILVEVGGGGGSGGGGGGNAASSAPPTLALVAAPDYTGPDGGGGAGLVARRGGEGAGLGGPHGLGAADAAARASA